MLNFNSKLSQIGIRWSGTRKCSQRYGIDHFYQVFFSAIQPSKFFHNPGKGSFRFAHSMSDIPMTPRGSLRSFRNWNLACSQLHIKTDFEIYGSSIGVCNYVIRSNPISQSNKIKSNQSIHQSNQINQSINQIKSNQMK